MKAKSRSREMQKIHSQKHYNHRQFKPEATRFLAAALAGLIGGALLIAFYLRANGASSVLLCSGALGGDDRRDNATASSLQTRAILHYATSRIVPQQSLGEITVSFDVLGSLGGAANLLVFGLGHDSMMWAAMNPRGKTLFLEEDPKWVQTVLRGAPDLRADTVRYRTRLAEANELMRHYRSESDCAAERSFLRGNDNCRLALNMLAEEVYETEWDMIMVDAPRGYFAEAPGRMAAIYSAAVMARNRRKSGATHVFVHDVDRRVERVYAEAFLCRKNLVKAVGRLWHFEILPPANRSKAGFC